MEQKNIKKMVITAMFAALACVATMVIQVPSFGPSGYVNLGDCIVLLSAWILGGSAGALAAGLGSGLADVLTGYAFYAPGTFVIKFLMALIAWLIVKQLQKLSRNQVVGYVISAVAAEIVMIVGYLFYEAVILGYGAAALAAVVSNAIQGGMNVVIGVIMIEALAGAKVLAKLQA